MLNDARGFKKIFLATGYTDLRRGMEGLAAIIRFQFELDPYDKNRNQGGFLPCRRLGGAVYGGRTLAFRRV